MKIVVTGSAGTLGTPLVAALKKHGHKVTGLDIRDTPGCDVANMKALTKALSAAKPELVYHAAAEFGRNNGEEFYEKMWRTNAIGTKNIIRLQEAMKFRLVHFSSSEIYGDYRGSMEETVPHEFPVHQLCDYAMSKWVNEMQIRNSASRFGTESVIVRLFNVYGPGEHYSVYRSVNCRFLYSAMKGVPWKVHTGHRRTSLYVDDCISTLCAISEKFHKGEVFNIGGDVEHTIEQLSDAVAKVAGVDPALGERVDSEPMTTTQKRVDSGKARNMLGHNPQVGLEEGLTRTLAWMRSEN